MSLTIIKSLKSLRAGENYKSITIDQLRVLEKLNLAKIIWPEEMQNKHPI